MRPVLLAGGVLGLFASLACAPEPATDEGVPDFEREGVQSGVIERIEKLRTAVGNQPEDAQRWGRLAMVADAHGLWELAEAAYRGAAELAPHDFRYPYHLAVVLAMQ